MVNKKNLSEAPNEARSEGGWEEKYKRARADYANLERRVKEQQKELIRYTNEVLVLKLLPVIDDLENATKNNRDGGLELVLKNLQEVLKLEGVEEIKVEVGSKFDPEVMEGIVAEGTELKVAEVLKKGYKFKDRVLRAVQVKVGGENAKNNRN